MNNQLSFGFRQLFDQDTWTFTYLLWDQDTKEGVIIDPVREQFERDMCLVGELGVKMVYALDTHVHADHVTSLGMLREEMGLKTAVGEPSGVPCADIMLNDGYTLRFGRHTLTALATPGHTDACTSYTVENVVFTGDTLFIRGCGRTDFQQGDPSMLFRSITRKLYTLPDETLVYPGHDYNGKSVSTIGEEMQHNPRIPATQTEADFTELMNSLNLPRPKHIDEAVPANLGCGISIEHGHLTEELFGVSDLKQILTSLPDDEIVIDCRTPDEYTAGHIPGAINIPMGKELEQMGKLHDYSKIYLYCHSGRRSQAMFTSLSGKGLENVVCLGSSGMAEWKKLGFDVEN
jgi:glyoxylase-like metal-dependent hydrolase (beta-lactamase superfamily II)/rhodanese-related sulfurtransferase